MSAIFKRIFGEHIDQTGLTANPFLEDVGPYLKDLKKLLQTESAASLAARMEAEPGRAELYGGNAVQLRDAICTLQQGYWRVEEGGPTGRHPEDRQQVLNELEQILAEMNDRAIEALPRVVELGVSDAENWQTSWNYAVIDELKGLLYEAYSSEEQEEHIRQGTALQLPDLRPVLTQLQGIGPWQSEDWSPHALQYEIDDQEYYTTSGEKLVDLFEGVIRYVVEYGGDAPGNGGTGVVYLCRDDCLKRLLEGVSAICGLLRRSSRR